MIYQCEVFSLASKFTNWRPVCLTFGHHTAGLMCAFGAIFCSQWHKVSPDGNCHFGALCVLWLQLARALHFKFDVKQKSDEEMQKVKYVCKNVQQTHTLHRIWSEQELITKWVTPWGNTTEATSLCVSQILLPFGAFSFFFCPELWQRGVGEGPNEGQIGLVQAEIPGTSSTCGPIKIRLSPHTPLLRAWFAEGIR